MRKLLLVMALFVPICEQAGMPITDPTIVDHFTLRSQNAMMLEMKMTSCDIIKLNKGDREYKACLRQVIYGSPIR